MREPQIQVATFAGTGEEKPRRNRSQVQYKSRQRVKTTVYRWHEAEATSKGTIQAEEYGW